MLAQTAGAVVGMNVSVIHSTAQTKNLLATTITGLKNRTVMFGAHLDSVRSGPGINDNGSGSILVLQLAIAMVITCTHEQAHTVHWHVHARTSKHTVR